MEDNGGDKEKKLTHDIDTTGWTGEAIGVVLNDVCRLEDPLDRAGFDIELVIAEAVFPVAPALSAL